MSGKILMTGLVLFSIIFGVALWYSQTRAYYHDVSGVTSVTIAGHDVSVVNYAGIDANTSPLKMRACFTVSQGAPNLRNVLYSGVATPLNAPPQFDCFQADQIQHDLDNGTAVAVLGAGNTPYGFDRLIALYPDNSAFMWREINACGRAVFAGDPSPEGCPPKPEPK